MATAVTPKDQRTEAMPKTVLITGCSSGIGESTALAFSAAGWNVIATMRDVTRWKASHPASILVLPLDVQDDAAVESALLRSHERFGGIDCVVNNAGQGLLSVFETTPLDLIRSIFETNTFAVMRITQRLIPHFRSRGNGCVVNVTSSAGFMPEPLMAAYSASKWAVEGFTESLH